MDNHSEVNDGRQASKCSEMPGLYIVSTPIGNLGDLPPRAIDIMRAVDVIACEDSRVTGRLLKLHGINTQMLPYHDHSSPKTRDAIIRKLNDGKTVALVSDAGTPLISDPGYRLVRAAVNAGVMVTAAPGPSSPVMALVLSGLPTDRFFFGGYLPHKQKARRDILAEVATIRATLVFLESPKRLAGSVAAMAEILGDRPAAVARELTKLHEEIRRGDLNDLARDYSGMPPPKGEVVVVIGPPGTNSASEEEVDMLLLEALATMSVRDAAATVAAATCAPRKYVYSRALFMSKAAGDVHA
jgi:16S rRNA (cytidine1402-2'-O)-methyltransferase